MYIFIVMLRHTMDDLPVAAYAGAEGKDAETAKAIAFALAKRIEEMPSEAVRDVYETDCSTPVCVSVVEMRDGIPYRVTVVKDFAGTC